MFVTEMYYNVCSIVFSYGSSDCFLKKRLLRVHTASINYSFIPYEWLHRKEYKLKTVQLVRLQTEYSSGQKPVVVVQ